MKTLSVATEEFRSVFANIGESNDNAGLFPFQFIKDVRRGISGLGFGPAFDGKKAAATPDKITAEWRVSRRRFLSELERGIPLKPDSRYLK
jgi:hypothetical protein